MINLQLISGKEIQNETGCIKLILDLFFLVDKFGIKFQL
jgi:hypothetical protein